MHRAFLHPVVVLAHIRPIERRFEAGLDQAVELWVLFEPVGLALEGNAGERLVGSKPKGEDVSGNYHYAP